MLNSLEIRWHQFLEETEDTSLLEAVRKSVRRFVHFDRIVVPVYLELYALKEHKYAQGDDTVTFCVIHKDNADGMASKYLHKSRSLKCRRNVRSGYRGYAVTVNDKVVGDMWCATPPTDGGEVHPDCQWLGIRCSEREAYMFDLYVLPQFRGKVITYTLVGDALRHLKESGYTAVHGYFEKNYFASRWVHRYFGYQELTHRKIARFFFYSTSERIEPAVPAPSTVIETR